MRVTNYELLTDLGMIEIQSMKGAVANQTENPMVFKKRLAQMIVADFHAADAAVKAADDWSKLRNKELVTDALPDNLEEVRVSYGKIRSNDAPDAGTDSIIVIRLDRLLAICGLAGSVTDAGRKLKARSVELLPQDKDRGEIYSAPNLPIVFRGFPSKLILRVGKKVKVALIEA